MKDKHVLNNDIKAKLVNVVVDGEMLTNISINEALEMAEKQNMDLVQVSDSNGAIVCKVMDYGKLVYDNKKKQKKVSKKSSALKEIKFRPSTDVGDVQTKVKKIESFLSKNHDVKITLQFKGRENTHKEVGFSLIQEVLNKISVKYTIKQPLQVQGRFITCIVS